MPYLLMRKYFISLLFVFVISTDYLHAQSLSWAGHFAGGIFKLIGGQDVDQSGNQYIVGGFQGTVDFDPGPGVLNLTTSGGFAITDIFIVKQSANGNLVWVKQIGSTATDVARKVTYNNAGYLEIVGDFRGTVDFDPGAGVVNLTAGPNGDAFILRLSADGNFISIRQFASSTGSSIGIREAETDNSGNLILVTGFSGTIDYDPGPGVLNLTSSGGDNVICKFSSSGNLIWAKQIFTASVLATWTMSVDSENKILFAGYFENTIDFDPGPGIFNMTSDGNSDAFITKLDASGNFLWAKQFKNLGLGSVFCMALDAGDNLFVGGFYEGDTDFDPGPGVFTTIYLGGRDAFVVKLTKEGNFVWAKTISGVLDEQVSVMSVAMDGNALMSFEFQGNPDFDPGPGTHIVTSNGGTDIAIVKFTATGGLDNIKQIGGTAGDFITCAQLDNDDNYYMSGLFASTVDFDPGPAVFNLTATTVNEMFTAKFGRSNYITGNVFQDNNANGIYDAGEYLLSNVLIKAVRAGLNYYAISDTNGYYNLAVDTGSYVITPVFPQYYNAAIPMNQNAAFGALYGRVDTANHFALTPVGMIKDLSAYITNLGPARAGRTTYYRISYLNRGTEAMNASIQLNHDGMLTFNTSSPIPNNYNAPVAVWNFNNLQPSRSGNIDIAATVSSSVVNGNILKSYATINPVAGDANAADNTDTVFHVVTGSFDPNDKKVLPDGAISTGFVSGGSYLNYTIRFQNTGNDTAFLVAIRDTLSNNADINSFQMLSASHPYTVDMHENGIVEWRFENILLPDSNINEPRSHGFVRYRVKPKSSLVPGNEVRNKASIYFDYNTPVVTNETVNIVTVVTGVNPGPEIIGAKVFPNPTGSELFIQCKGEFSYKVFNVAGQLVMSKENNRDEAEIRVVNVQKGVYMVLISNRNGKAVQRIVIQ
jgi:uncharacterized repeat protein (TIGR01451 family)